MSNEATKLITSTSRVKVVMPDRTGETVGSVSAGPKIAPLAQPAPTRGVGNYTVFHFKVRGVPFGAYRWRRNLADGLVLRVGPLGHVQFQAYRMRIVGRSARRRDGRRGKHGIAVHFWGVRGRRRKVGIELSVTL